MFLQNGARFYVDCGAHPELTTPECPNPWDIVRYIKAGERILAGLASELTKEVKGIPQAFFFRHNVDYSGALSTWGSHESYLHRADPGLFRHHLIPHLVSRLIYAGAGGFNSRAAGIQFILSPRVPHLEVEVSPQSTGGRGILHTKDETLSSSPYHRLHLLCSESLHSEVALFLRLGATALTVALIEAGLRPGDGVELLSPLSAMQTFAGDPTCALSVPDKRGQCTSALAIQRHYLEMAEAHQHDAFMPPWAPEVCSQWRAMLDRLATGPPESVAAELDWAVKYLVFREHARQRGFAWETLGHWNGLLERVVGALRERKVPAQIAGADYILGSASPVKDVVDDLRPVLGEAGLSWDGLGDFLALREELFEIDTRFGQVGDQGIFAAMNRAGVLQDHVPGVDNLEHAMAYPPAIGRAGLRGSCVRRFGSKRTARRVYACDWTGVWDYEGKRFLDLTDPFAWEEKWRDLSPAEVANVGLLAGSLGPMRALGL
jgi:hypothetical protein